jgi:hypothetical protein
VFENVLETALDCSPDQVDGKSIERPMTYSRKPLWKRAKRLTAQVSQAFGARAEEEDKAMGPGVEPHRRSRSKDREAVAPLGEDAQQAAGQGLPSVGGDKRDRVVGTGAALTSNQVQVIGSMQQFIDEATTRDKHTQWQDFLELLTGHPQGVDDFIRGHEKGSQPTYPVFSKEYCTPLSRNSWRGLLRSNLFNERRKA